MLALPRLAEMLETDTEGGAQAACQLVFGRDGAGRDIVQGEVRACLTLRCQRCLEPFDLPVASEFTLALVVGLDEVAALPPDYDPLLVAAAGEDRFIHPRDLIEDELILAVPAVPRHADGGCPSSPLALLDLTPAQVADRPAERLNPFAVLTTLLKEGR